MYLVDTNIILELLLDQDKAGGRKTLEDLNF
jgi:predicted nucleic acid-binding protein